jgi:hypothetical protein
MSNCIAESSVNHFIIDLEKFDEKFASKINQKEIQVLSREFYFRNNFIHDEKISKIYEVILNNDPFPISLLASIKPLCFSTILLQIARPIPNPSNSCLL